MKNVSTKVNLFTPKFSLLERFLDALKIRTSSKRLIEVDWLFLSISQNFPTNTENLKADIRDVL